MYDENENSPTLEVEPIHIFEDNGLTPDITQDGDVIETFNPKDIDRDGTVLSKHLCKVKVISL